MLIGPPVEATRETLMPCRKKQDRDHVEQCSEVWFGSKPPSTARMISCRSQMEQGSTKVVTKAADSLGMARPRGRDVSYVIEY